MRITLFTNSLDFGGASTFFIRLNEAFNNNNINCNIVAFNNERNNEQDNLSNNSLIYRIKYLRNKCKENDSDAIITNYGLETLIAKVATIFLKKKMKIISVVHVRPIMWIPDNMNYAKRVIFKSLIKVSFSTCDKCVSVSNDLREEIINGKWIGSEKITTIYNPVIDDSRTMKVNKKLNTNEIKLGLIGWIWDIKNQEEAIRALGKLDDKRVKLHLIGGVKDKNYYDKLIQLIKDLKLEEQVVFGGIKEDVFEELKKIDILLLTSKTEALPTVIIEALSCGVPVIARDCKVGPKEILDRGKWGKLYDFSNEDILISIIQELLSNEELYKSISKNGLIRAEDFTYKKSMIRYKNLIENI